MQLKPSDGVLLKTLQDALADPDKKKNHYRKLRFDRNKASLRCRQIVEDVVFGPIVEDEYAGSPAYDYLHSILGARKNFDLLTEVLALMLSLAKLEKGVPVAWLSTTWLKTCWDYEKHVEDRKIGINDKAARRCLDVLRIAGIIRVVKPGEICKSCTHYAFSSTLLRLLERDFKWVGLSCVEANYNQSTFNKSTNVTMDWT